MQIDKFIDENNWVNWVGQRIVKHSNKPFKSGLKIGNVIELTNNKYSDKKAFLMCDGSVVDCYQCKLIEDEL